MKKIIITLLSLVLALAFVGCTNTAATTTTAAAAQGDKTRYTGQLSFGLATEESLWEDAKEQYGENHIFANGLGVGPFKLFEDMSSALLALQRGDIICIATNQSTAEYVAAQEPDKYEAVDYGSANHLAFAMVLKEDNQALLDKLNSAIAALKEEGALEALEKEYLTDLTKLPEVREIPTVEGAETVRVVVTGDQPPFDYVTADGKAAGYNVALLTAISQKANLNIELVYANAGSRYVQLTSGKADVVFWARGETKAESAEFSFADDLPQGMTVTEAYLIQEWRDIMLKTAE